MVELGGQRLLALRQRPEPRPLGQGRAFVGRLDARQRHQPRPQPLDLGGRRPRVGAQGVAFARPVAALHLHAECILALAPGGGRGEADDQEGESGAAHDPS
jgi:hypothetical protein